MMMDCNAKGITAHEKSYRIAANIYEGLMELSRQKMEVTVPIAVVERGQVEGFYYKSQGLWKRLEV